MRRISLILFATTLVLIVSSTILGQQGPPTEKGTTDWKPVEFSNLSDKQVSTPGTIDGADPEQVLFTVPRDLVGPPNPRNSAFDYGGSGEVDAIANVHDYLFGSLIANRKALLVSFAGDPIPTGLTEKCAVYMETPSGVQTNLWRQMDIENPVSGLDDVDGLELYQTLDADDANRYSLVGDAISGTSVFKANGQQFVPWTDIVNAVQDVDTTAANDPDTIEIDLDALMVKEAWGENGPDSVWGSGDTIVFSIRALPNLGTSGWHGGELVVLPFGGPAFYLTHGGKQWDHTFSPKAAFGVPTDEVDAIEVIDQYKIPTLTNYGLLVLLILLILSGVYVIYQRRKGVVRA